MAEFDAAAYSAGLKEYYDESKLVELVAIESPMLAMLMRGKLVGELVPLPMATDPGQASTSATFATANTNRGPGTYKRFVLDDVRRVYTVGQINRDMIDRAETPAGAFEGVTVETNLKLGFNVRELAHTLFRTENGSVGAISSVTDGTGEATIVVEDPSDIRNLGVGAKLVASQTAAGALRDSGAVYTITSIVYSTGTIVVDGEVVGTSSWAIGDTLHREGNAPNGSTAKLPSGFQDWIVGSGVSATLFRGLDRSSNPELLAGIKIDLGSSSIREAISELAARLMAQGGRPTQFWVNPLKFQELEMELDGIGTVEKIVPPGFSGELAAQIGFNSIRVAAGNGNVRIMSDPMAPYTKGIMLTPGTFKFYELGGKRQPRLVDMGGGNFLRMEDADAVKFQTEAKGDLGCSNPGANGIIDFAA